MLLVLILVLPLLGGIVDAPPVGGDPGRAGRRGDQRRRARPRDLPAVRVRPTRPDRRAAGRSAPMP